jgi:hypothetical protein
LNHTHRAFEPRYTTNRHIEGWISLEFDVQTRHSELRPLEDARGPTSYEKHVRALANHLALTVQRRGTDLVLSEKYKSKRVLGSFRSFTAVARWLDQYLDSKLRKFDQEDIEAYEKQHKRETRKKQPKQPRA